MSRRFGLLAVALVVALLGTFAVFSYVSQVEAKTLTGAEPVDVLVAVQRLSSGTSGAAAAKGGLVELVAMPRKSVPEGALTSLDAVGKQTLVSDVFAGEVLLKAKFADQSARTGDLVIPKDKIAMSVELEDPQRVAGFVVPGSEVAIFATIDKMSAKARATATGTQTSANSATVNVEAEAEVDDSYTELLLPRTSVIAVGPGTLRPAADKDKGEDKGEDEVTKAVLTVAVTQAEAERLVHGVQQGELYLGLLSTTSKTGPGVGVTNTSLFD
jgi:pilus assembly protein CpaB